MGGGCEGVGGEAVCEREEVKRVICRCQSCVLVLFKDPSVDLLYGVWGWGMGEAPMRERFCSGL